MRLAFEYTQTIGQGSSPQVVHMMDNGLKIIYISDDGLVKGLEAFPTLGLYDNLTYKDIGRISADFEVSKPSLKKVAHYGAYGFWSAEDMHKFVMYMLPTDVSHTHLNGNLSYSKGSVISQLSISLQNAGGELVSRYRSIIAPNTVIELYFSLGNSDELPLGRFYIDRTSIGYPEQSIGVLPKDIYPEPITPNDDRQITAYETMYDLENVDCSEDAKYASSYSSYILKFLKGEIEAEEYVKYVTDKRGVLSKTSQEAETDEDDEENDDLSTSAKIKGKDSQQESVQISLFDTV